MRQTDLQPANHRRLLVTPVAGIFKTTSMALLVAVVAAAGCTRSGPMASTEAESEEKSSHEGHEHHVPQHKPGDLPDAIRSLRGRCAELLKDRRADQPTVFARQFGETNDIVGWLPELAADSDLGRAEWENVNDVSKRLTEELALFNAAQTDESAKETYEKIESELESLDEVVHRNAELFQIRSAGNGQHQNQ